MPPHYLLHLCAFSFHSHSHSHTFHCNRLPNIVRSSFRCRKTICFYFCYSMAILITACSTFCHAASQICMRAKKSTLRAVKCRRICCWMVEHFWRSCQIFRLICDEVFHCCGGWEHRVFPVSSFIAKKKSLVSRLRNCLWLELGVFSEEKRKNSNNIFRTHI